jgi:secreted PhoX family phosphatase
MFSNDESNNPSTHASMQDVIDNCNHERRFFLKCSLGTATLATFAGAGLSANAAAKALTSAATTVQPLIGFTSVAANTVPLTDAVTVPDGYSARVLVAWGDAIMPAPNWDPATEMTESIQLRTYGAHTDGMNYFPLSDDTREGSKRGLLVANNEYNDPGLLFNTATYSADAMTLERARAQQAAHGVSIAEVHQPRRNGPWLVERLSAYGRRITGNTLMRIAGPAAGHPLMQTADDASGRRVLGTLNNCANGYTPWGTYLTCEENWNGYFGSTDAGFVQTVEEKRYGVSATGFGYRWYEADPRFDVRVNPNEPHRFGWVVEIDPFDPHSVPVKRTALGRIKHEGAWSVVDDERNVAVYMGDDERNEYVYKFVASRKYIEVDDKLVYRNFLDDGILYVARFNDDGTGEWLPLVWGQNGLTPENGFADQAEVLIKTRQAADRLGATMMDRPEWGAVHPDTREVYMTMTNNSKRGDTPVSSNSVDGSTGAGSAKPAVVAADPRPDNDFGHIVRWRETGNVVTATTFEWDLFVQCGDKATTKTLGSSYTPVEFDGQTVGYAGNINGDDYGAPDGLWFDQDGRLWIQTDQAGDGQGDWANIGGNVMMCADVTTGETRRFLTAPPNAEVTGVTTTPNGKTMFVGIQHPGEDWVGSYVANSSWPDNAANGATTASSAGAVKPRSAVVVITKDDGGVIGS